MQREGQNPTKVLPSRRLSFRKREIEPIKDFAIIKLVIQRERIHQRFWTSCKGAIYTWLLSEMKLKDCCYQPLRCDINNEKNLALVCTERNIIPINVLDNEIIDTLDFSRRTHD
jgi:hypothetical protein